jgi:hypothetical protein
MASVSSANNLGALTPITFARSVCVLTWLTIQTGCVTSPPNVCSPGLGAPMLVFDLFFGISTPGRNDLTEAEWQDFRYTTITANLPNGYTVLDASGAWMSPVTRRTINEASRVVVVALPDSAESVAAVNRIRTEYQVRFHQQLVGLTATHTCGSF